MKRTEKTYKFKFYEEELANDTLIKEIRKAIFTLPAIFFSYVIVDLYDFNSDKLGIPYFQTTRERAFKKTDLYTVEICLKYSGSDGKHQCRMYQKKNQPKEQVLSAFEEICVKRTFPDLSEWAESDVWSDEVNQKDKNLKLLKTLYSDYYSIDLPNHIDEIKYLESLRYFADNHKGYTADKIVGLADQYCNNGQYEKAKELYEMTTFAPDSTYKLANLIMTGKLGKPNYKLAYEYYKHTCIIGDTYYFGANIEIAKMHRDGKYLKPDYRQYRKIIKRIEKEYEIDGGIYPDLENLYYELALIEQADGNVESAIKYCLSADNWVKTFLSYGGDEELIISAKRIFKLLYSLTEFNKYDACFLHFTFIENTPYKIIFTYDNNKYELESFFDKEKYIFKFDGKYYNGLTNFLLKATLDGHRLLQKAEEITIIEVLQ